MIFGVEGVDPARRQRLIDLLDVDLDWRMNKVSDGQRRRVQICMGLLKPFKVRSSPSQRSRDVTGKPLGIQQLRKICRRFLTSWL